MSTVVVTFNTPLEAGVRALMLLASAPRRSLDVQRLMYFDYAMVHTADFGGPASLHPRTPSQSAQLLVRRALIQDGLDLMRSRDLVERVFLRAGISYRVTHAGRHLAGEFSCPYADRLRDHAAWVVREFGKRSDSELRRLVAERVRPYGDELVSVQAPGTATLSEPDA